MSNNIEASSAPADGATGAAAVDAGANDTVETQVKVSPPSIDEEAIAIDIKDDKEDQS